MSLFEKFNQAFGFTTTERRVVLFLVITLVAGAGIKVFKSTAGGTPAFNYSSADSEFAARSQLLSSADSIIAGDSLPQHAGKPQNTSPSMVSQSHNDGSKININSATKEELVKLPGVGEAMAEKIILFREDNGPFKSVSDLAKIKGIGKKKMEKLLPLCTVGN